MKKAVFLLVLCLSFVTISYSQTTRFVKTVASGTGDGSSWANASSDLQAMIHHSSINGTILIAKGTYTLGKTVHINKPLTLRGGFTPDGGSQEISNNPTIIDGMEAHRVITATHGSGTLTLQGLIIQNGRVSGSSAEGGGIYSVGDLHLQNTRVQHNAAYASTSSGTSSYSYGGGIYTSSGSIVLSNSQIVDNTATTTFSSYTSSSSYSYGGGIYTSSGKIELVNSQITNNSAHSSSYSSDNSYTSYSSSYSYGGGIYTSNGRISLVNSLVNDNISSSTSSSDSSASSYSSTSSGGGIYAESGSIYLANSEVRQNSTFSTAASDSNYASSESYGGGMYTSRGSIRLTNSQVSQNTISAISSSYSSTAISSSKGGGIYGNTILLNSLIWANEEYEKVNNSIQADGFNEHEIGSLSTSHSLIRGRDLSSSNGINARIADFNPLFVNALNGNFRLRADSPLINAGKNSFNTSSTDLDGNKRIAHKTIDIGAYENISGAVNIKNIENIQGTSTINLNSSKDIYSFHLKFAGASKIHFVLTSVFICLLLLINPFFCLTLLQ